MEDDNVVSGALRTWVMAAAEEPESLSAMEQQLRQWLFWLGNLMLQFWLVWLARGYAGPERACPHCTGRARYQRQRSGRLQTMFGRVPYRRAYYVCSSCHQGHAPLDLALGLRPNAMSAEVERLAALVGVQMPFAQGQAVFEALTLVRLSDQSLDKAAQAYGTSAQAEEVAWLAQTHDAEAMLRRERAPARPVRLYGTIDGGRVQTRQAVGEDQPWRELKIGAWFEAKGQPPSTPDGQWRIQAHHISYFTDIAPAETFGQLVWATGVQRDAQRAHELIFLGDGAKWIWDLVSQHFPQAVQIVDWFHACEYLMPVAKAAFPDARQQADWVQRVRTDLWQGRLEAVMSACAQLCDPRRPDDPAQKALTYFTNNRQRMDYPTYRANGYQIGSGTIESGVKQIATQRMKVAGARWNVASARLVAKARAAFLSHQWDALAARRLRLPSCA
jgi:hypothetical protein